MAQRRNEQGALAVSGHLTASPPALTLGSDEPSETRESAIARKRRGELRGMTIDKLKLECKSVGALC